MEEALRKEFEAFVRTIEPSLHRALVAAYGFERGRDATAEALGWAWEHWDRAKDLDNKVGYLFRVGQSRSRDRKTPITFERDESSDPWFDPGLISALASLTEHQRVAVVLVNGFDWKLREVAELLDVGVSTVQSHVERGMRSLRNALEVVEND